MIPKPNQAKIITRISEEIVARLKRSEGSIFTFKGPTGGGKTPMSGYGLYGVQRCTKMLSPTVWISLRELPEQSMKELKKCFEGTSITVKIYPNDFVEPIIKPNQILVINWEKLNRKDQRNILMRYREDDKDFTSIIENTKHSSNDIILIIDESHLFASTKNSMKLIRAIDPKVTMRVSATPDDDRGETTVEYLIEDAKSDGLIKKNIIVNYNLDNIDRTLCTTEMIINLALQQRLSVQMEAIKMGIQITILCIIQLPNDGKYSKYKLEEIKTILDKHEITVENGKLAVWLSNDHNNLEDIEDFNSKVEVLICKIAPTVGWNCRRASILIPFRDSKDIQFNSQTLGRILRTLEARHYDNMLLDNGFVYTNIGSMRLADDIAKKMIVTQFATRNKDYNNFNLPVTFLRRHREGKKLRGLFTDIFDQVAIERDLVSKLTTTPINVTSRIMRNVFIKNIDEPAEIESKDTLEYVLSPVDVNAEFDSFLSGCLDKNAQCDSLKIMKTTIYRFFHKGFEFALLDSRVPTIVMCEENKQIMKDALNLAVQRFDESYISSNGKITSVPANFEVPEKVWYSPLYEEIYEPKSILQPSYMKKSSKIETAFRKCLSRSEDVLDTVKNGDDGEQWFSVPYTDIDGIEKSFFPDFLGHYINGKKYIYDTKDGNTAKVSEAGPRSNALQRYILEQRKNGVDITGGIVIHLKEQDCWKVYTKPEYMYKKDDYSQWTVLSF